MRELSRTRPFYFYRYSQMKTAGSGIINYMNPNTELLKFIQQSLSAGKSKDEVIKALKDTGWQDADIAAGFSEIEKTSTAPVQPQPAQFQQPGQFQQQPRSYKKLIISISAGIVVVALLGGGAYAYFMKLGPFAHAPYAEDNLMSGILLAASKIDTSSYSISASVSVGKRDADAEPFSSKLTLGNAAREMYKNDSARAQNAGAILQYLQTLGYSQKTNPYPATAKQLLVDAGKQKYYYTSKLSITDPKTEEEYGYRRSGDGKNFELTINFETDNAIVQLKKIYNFKPEATRIEGKRVTFTKDSSSYLYISSEPPEPFLVSLQEMVNYAPPEMNVSFSASAQTDWEKETADWKFNGDATGDLGDLTYKLNADALKKDGIYYLRVNNIPSIFLGFIGNIKGQWIKIDPNAATSSEDASYGDFSYFTNEVPDAEKKYKENRRELLELIQKAATIADEEKLFAFENAPRSENVEGRSLYRYDLKIRKEAVALFYERLIKEADKKSLTTDYSLIADRGYLEYLKSPEFNEAFDYYDKNAKLTLWADANGYPAIITYTIRAVPSDSATTLKDKQINIVFKVVISDINKEVKIDAPKDSKTFYEISDEISGGALSIARMKARDARRMADLSQLRLAFELYYDEKNGYPAKLSDVSPKYSQTLPTDPTTKAQYYYTYHTLKNSRDSYHLGASLESRDSVGLANDKDCNSKTDKGCGAKGSGAWSSTAGFDGDDSRGCGGEIDRYCYDILPF